MYRVYTFQRSCNIFLRRIMLPFVWFDSTLCSTFYLLTIFYADVICLRNTICLWKTETHRKSHLPTDSSHISSCEVASLPLQHFSFQNKLKCWRQWPGSFVVRVWHGSAAEYMLSWRFQNDPPSRWGSRPPPQSYRTHGLACWAPAWLSSRLPTSATHYTHCAGIL